MVIGAAGDEHRVRAGDLEIAVTRLRVVIGMIRLERIQPRVVQFLDPAVDGSKSRVCERRETAGLVNDGNHLFRRRAASRDEAGASPRQPSLECIVRVDSVPGGDKRAGDLRTANGAAVLSVRAFEKRRDVDWRAQPAKALGDLLHALDPALALAFEEARERSAAGVHEIAEHVDVAAVLDSGDLDAGNERDAGRRAEATDFPDSRHRIVIGDGDPLQTGGGALLYQLLR